LIICKTEDTSFIANYDIIEYKILSVCSTIIGDVSFLVEILKERFRQHIVYLI